MSGPDRPRIMRTARWGHPLKLALVALLAANLVISGTGVAGASAEEPPVLDSLGQVGPQAAADPPSIETAPEESLSPLPSSKESTPEEDTRANDAPASDEPTTDPAPEPGAIVDEPELIDVRDGPAAADGLAEIPPLMASVQATTPELFRAGGDDGLSHVANFVALVGESGTVRPGDVLARLYSDVPDILQNPVTGRDTVRVRLEYTGPRGICTYGTATRSTGPNAITLSWGATGDRRVPAALEHAPQTGAEAYAESVPGKTNWSANTAIGGQVITADVLTATFQMPAELSIPAMWVEIYIYEYYTNQHGQCIRIGPYGMSTENVAGAELEADFVATVSATDPLEVGFESRSTDSQQSTAQLDHAWDFGDGHTSSDVNPTHRFESPGTYEVTVTVTNDRGQSDNRTREVTVSSGLTVNSTGDGAAEDPADGCDTGGTVNGEPECTLRAAIEAANATGGGEIGFDIAGTPVIPLGSALPRVTVPVTIDGTTQDGGWVEVIGGGEKGIVLAGGASTVTGLALHGAEQAIRIESGEGHIISGVRVGLDRSGAPTSDTDFGVVAVGGSAEVRESESGAEVGIAGRVPITVTGNRLGIDAGGAPIPGTLLGVWVQGPGTVVSGNTIYGETAGVLVHGADATGAQVTGNEIGMDGPTAFSGAGIGVSIQGAPGATIADNTIESESFAGVLVSGSEQLIENGDEVQLGSPLDGPADGTVTGGDATVTGNTIGSGADDSGLAGVWAWAGASDLMVGNNTVRAATTAAVILDGGTGNRVAGNTLGSQAAPLTGSGIDASSLGEAAIESNSIFSAGTGIRAAGQAPTVTGNTVTGSGSDAIGINLEAERTGIELRQNTVRQTASSGILANGPGLVLAGNIVTQSGVAITTSGEGISLRENLIGVETANGGVLGNTGHGVWVNEGSIEASRNVIAGSGGDGVHVAAGATAKLTANRIWASGGAAIVNPDGPATPGIVAAIIADTDGSSMTTLLIDGLEEGETGTIEVFANDAAADAEAQHVLDATRTIEAHEIVRVVQLASGRDHFTLTFTDSSGNTSELSPVSSRQAFPDSDGDGAVDPIDGILGLEQDPTVAILATRNEQLLLARVTPYDLEEDFGGGQFENLRVVDDPTPGAHPEGWSLPYGALAFRITDLPYAGARTSVMFASFYGDDPLLGNAYWKYGPQSPGGEPNWYEFSWDDQTQTGGATRVADLGSLGFRPAHVLTLEDGARGDSDGGMNRSITDPGGPVIYTGGGGENPVPDPDSTTTASDRLARTGADSAALQISLSIALLLAVLGSALLLRGRTRRRIRH